MFGHSHGDKVTGFRNRLSKGLTRLIFPAQTAKSLAAEPGDIGLGLEKVVGLPRFSGVSIACRACPKASP